MQKTIALSGFNFLHDLDRLTGCECFVDFANEPAAKVLSLPVYYNCELPEDVILFIYPGGSIEVVRYDAS